MDRRKPKGLKMTWKSGRSSENVWSKAVVLVEGMLRGLMLMHVGVVVIQGAR